METKIQYTKIEDLKNFERPTSEQIKQYYNYLHPKLKSGNNFRKWFTIILITSFIFAGMIIMPNKQYISAKDIAGFILLAVFVLMICIIVPVISKTDNKFHENLKTGNYKVIQVYPYAYCYGYSNCGTCEPIKIRTKYHQYLKTAFDVDYETAIEVKNQNYNIPMTLIYDPTSKESRVITPNMLK